MVQEKGLWNREVWTSNPATRAEVLLVEFNLCRRGPNRSESIHHQVGTSCIHVQWSPDLTLWSCGVIIRPSYVEVFIIDLMEDNLCHRTVSSVGVLVYKLNRESMLDKLDTWQRSKHMPRCQIERNKVADEFPMFHESQKAKECFECYKKTFFYGPIKVPYKWQDEY